MPAEAMPALDNLIIQKYSLLVFPCFWRRNFKQTFLRLLLCGVMKQRRALFTGNHG